MKTGDALVFLNGILTVDVDAGGALAARDDDMDFDEKYRVLKIERSELIAIRDFLIRVLADVTSPVIGE